MSLPKSTLPYVVRPEIPEKAHEALGHYPALTRHLLFHRGIMTGAAALAFTIPDYEAHTHDAWLLKGLDVAVDRILTAIARAEKIVIYSDYDADGIPGAVVAHDFFTAIGYTHFSIYIPHRHHEGFGLNHEAIEKFIADGVQLLITIDCGITDVSEIAAAQKGGIDVIVTDHHEPAEGGVPAACAVVDPKQEGCAYPNKNICGAALFYKVACAVLSKQSFGVKPGQEKWWLDMVGIATLSDMVSLTGENRVFAHYGLKVLRKSRRPGLQELLRIIKTQQSTISEDDVGFMITPRINAASRMGVPMDAFSLLSARDAASAHDLAVHLNAINDERKGLVARISKEVQHHLAKIYTSPDKVPSVIVTGNPTWRPSLLGLVANTLVETYQRPVFLWGRETGSVYKGSCRSDGSVSVVHLMQHASHVFDHFGGHHGSGGFSVSSDHIYTFSEALIAAHAAHGTGLSEEAPILDAILPLSDVNRYTLASVMKLQPFGVGNAKPLFGFKNVIVDSVGTFGKQANHLKMSLRDDSLGQRSSVSAIAFFSHPTSFAHPVEQGKPATVIGTIEQSTFGRREIRLRIVAILPAHAL